MASLAIPIAEMGGTVLGGITGIIQGSQQQQDQDDELQLGTDRGLGSEFTQETIPNYRSNALQQAVNNQSINRIRQRLEPGVTLQQNNTSDIQIVADGLRQQMREGNIRRIPQNQIEQVARELLMTRFNTPAVQNRQVNQTALEQLLLEESKTYEDEIQLEQEISNMRQLIQDGDIEQIIREHNLNPVNIKDMDQQIRAIVEDMAKKELSDIHDYRKKVIRKIGDDIKNDGNKKEMISQKLGGDSNDMPQELKDILDEIDDQELTEGYRSLFKGVSVGPHVITHEQHQDIRDFHQHLLDDVEDHIRNLDNPPEQHPAHETNNVRRIQDLSENELEEIQRQINYIDSLDISDAEKERLYSEMGRHYFGDQSVQDVVQAHREHMQQQHQPVQEHDDFGENSQPNNSQSLTGQIIQDGLDALRRHPWNDPNPGDPDPFGGDGPNGGRRADIPNNQQQIDSTGRFIPYDEQTAGQDKEQDKTNLHQGDVYYYDFRRYENQIKDPDTRGQIMNELFQETEDMQEADVDAHYVLTSDLTFMDL